MFIVNSLGKEKFVLNDIIRADSKNLSSFIKPNSVALTITSPPYRNAINYSQHIKNTNKKTNDQFRGTLGLSTTEYLQEMKQIFTQVYKVTIDGGFCCIVIGDEVENGRLIPLPSLLIANLVNLTDSEDGWHLRDVIIWNKVTAGRNGAGNRFSIFVQNPIPTYYRSNIMHETIIVLQKGRKNRLMKKTKSDRIPLNRAMKRQVALSVWDFPDDEIDQAVKNESFKSVWDITPVPPRVVDHPAVFPEQIPWRLITLYSKKGDVILDPMNGSGQTTKVAKNLGRNYVGIDSRHAYVKLAKKRLNQPFHLSNFMIPLYLPIEWSKKDQSGKKDDAQLDISAPKDYEFIFQKKSSKEVLGVRGTYLYYKNKEDDWICYIIARSSKPTKIKLGSLSKPKSALAIVYNSLPKIDFYKAQLNEYLPNRIIENRQPIRAVMDVLEHEEFLVNTGKKHRGSELFTKIIPKKYHKTQKKIAGIIPN